MYILVELNQLVNICILHDLNMYKVPKYRTLSIQMSQEIFEKRERGRGRGEKRDRLVYIEYMYIFTEGEREREIERERARERER